MAQSDSQQPRSVDDEERKVVVPDPWARKGGVGKNPPRRTRFPDNPPSRTTVPESPLRAKRRLSDRPGR